MFITSLQLRKLVLASAATSALAFAATAAFADTAPSPISSATTARSTTIAMATAADQRDKRRAEMEQANADARRVAFRFLGTSL